MVVIRAHFDGRVLVPEGPVDLPQNEPLQIILIPQVDNERPLAGLADLTDGFPDDPEAPSDGAENHDHYLYGTPKRSP